MRIEYDRCDNCERIAEELYRCRCCQRYVCVDCMTISQGADICDECMRKGGKHEVSGVVSPTQGQL